MLASNTPSVHEPQHHSHRLKAACRLTIADSLLIVTLLVIALQGPLSSARQPPSGQLPTATLSVDGTVLASGPLSPSNSLPSKVKGLTIEWQDRRVRVASSDCPRRVCVRAGWIESPGESIVCVPHRVIITLHADSSSTVDAVSQ